MSQISKTATLSLRATASAIDVAALRELLRDDRLPTPVLLLSPSEIGRSYDTLRAALPRASIHYAVKSNGHPAILAEIRRRGGNFDICSAGELSSALATGVDPASLIHSHPVKSEQEFDAAVAGGIEMFVVDNAEEVKKLRRYADRKLKLLIRYRITTESKAVVDLQYKFGCLPEEVLTLASLIKEAGHEYYGLTFHIGSQCVYSQNYVKAIRTAQSLIHRLDIDDFNTRLLDIGGGFPVEYVQPIPTVEELFKPIRRALDEGVRPGIAIACEPGRFISAGAVTLVCSVIGRASRDGKQWYYLDDGLYSTFSGIVYDHCQYPVVCPRDGRAMMSAIAGPTCDSFDVMYHEIEIPELQVGDRVAFPMTGAYCSVSGSDFNSFPRPEHRLLS